MQENERQTKNLQKANGNRFVAAISMFVLLRTTTK
jgi:hypothetical protein